MSVKAALQYDYTAIGHVTIDVLEDGSRRAGGTALYSALQAARLGARTLLVTRAVPAEVEPLLAPFAGEFELQMHPASETTMLATSGSGASRVQRMLAWAGPLEDELVLDTAILHLAPVARETPRRWRGRGERVCLTPQGLARVWESPGSPISLARPSPADEQLAAGCSAVVISEHERACCAGLIAAAAEAGATVAVTNGGDPSTITGPGTARHTVHAPPIAHVVDDLGAGDVFAAAFFISLAAGMAPREAAELATAAAAVRMQGQGAQAVGGCDEIAARVAAIANAGD